MSPGHAPTQFLRQRTEIVGERDTAAVTHESKPQAPLVSVVPGAVATGPVGDDRFLHGHHPIEVGHEPATRRSRDEGVVRPVAPPDFVEPLGVHLHERGDVDERSSVASPDQIAGLRQYGEAADLGFRRVRAVRGCECGVLRYRSVRMEAEQELLCADHAVTLSP